LDALAVTNLTTVGGIADRFRSVRNALFAQSGINIWEDWQSHVRVRIDYRKDIVHVSISPTFPARFMLVTAMNP
jgi:hypothetical protein